MASVAVVLAVGARFSGQASSGTLTSRATVAARPRVESALAGEGDERHAQALQMGQQEHELGRLAGIGQGEQHIRARDHAQVAVAGLGRVQEERRGAGAGQGGGDLAADMAGFAHPGDHDPARATQADPAGGDERRTRSGRQRTRRHAPRSRARAAPEASSCSSRCVAERAGSRGGVLAASIRLQVIGAARREARAPFANIAPHESQKSRRTDPRRAARRRGAGAVRRTIPISPPRVVAQRFRRQARHCAPPAGLRARSASCVGREIHALSIEALLRTSPATAARGSGYGQAADSGRRAARGRGAHLRGEERDAADSGRVRCWPTGR